MLTRFPLTLRCLTLIALASVFAALLSGCIQLNLTRPSPAVLNQEKTCLRHFAMHDKLVASQLRADAQYARVKDHPFLRVNRLLAVLKTTLDTPEKRAVWMARLAALDKRARRLENGNLQNAGWLDLGALDDCRTSLVQNALASEQRFSAVLSAATVPDSYNLMARIAGVYPVTRWPVYRGALALHENENPRLAIDAAENTHYFSSRHTELGDIDRDATSPLQRFDALGFPLFSVEVLETLFDAYTPIWAIETRTEADKLGGLRWSNGRVEAGGSPTSYRQVSHVQFEGKLLVQLLYTVWFPSVPTTKAIDIYAGELDGLTFRVTLDHELRPLVVDIMHNCGCYYMAFPSKQLMVRGPSILDEEPLWIPYSLSAPALGSSGSLGRYTIQIRAGNHFVDGLTTAAPSEHTIKRLAVLPYDYLRELPQMRSGSKSVFSPRGLIENSHRLERYILWPMGIISAGAMRQSGHHAIAFVGRRHFDDPDLISRYFKRRTTDDYTADGKVSFKEVKR